MAMEQGARIIEHYVYNGINIKHDNDHTSQEINHSNHNHC